MVSSVRDDAERLLRRWSFPGERKCHIRWGLLAFVSLTSLAHHICFIYTYPPLSFCLLFRRDSKYNHVRIHTKSEGGKTKYFLTDQTLFDTIFELVDHYKQYPLRSPRFEQILSFPVPRQDSYERQTWFHDKLSSKAAEDMLKRVRMDGAFLVRPSGQDASKADHGSKTGKKMWAITFR